VAEIPLNGSATRFDYQSLDAGRGLLFLAHLGGDEVEVVNTSTDRVVSVIGAVPSPHGILVVPEAHRVFVSETGSQHVLELDEDTGTRIAEGQGGEFPDGLAYAATVNRLFVSDETGGGEMVLDGRTLSEVGRIDMGGAVGNTQVDTQTGSIVVAAEGREQLAIVDPLTLAVTARIPIPGCDGAHGFVVNAPARVAYVSCENNAKLFPVNLTSKQIGASFDVGDEPDVPAFDASLGRLYVASESGVVSVFHAEAGTLTKTGEAYLAPAAHSVAVDPMTHRVYVPLENVGGRPLLRVYEPT
jgi:DNA-binding beta-propeller fold protein YncE